MTDYQSDAVSGFKRKQGFQPRFRNHRLDEFAASYSLAGYSPAEPASASPAGSIFNRPAQLVNCHLRQVAASSTGIMRDFQLELTDFPGRFGLGVLLTWPARFSEQMHGELLAAMAKRGERKDLSAAGPQ